MLLRPLVGLRFRISFCAFFLFAVAAMAVAPYGRAQNLTGTVTNGTTDKPAAGAEVTLIKLANGMEEAGNAKTDSKGKFSFKLDDAGGPHLVRATFQGAQYFKMAPPGTSTADLTVYDASKQVDGISYTVDALRLETTGSQLTATRTFAINNQSKPPKTEIAEGGAFEFYLPDGAVIDSVMALGPGGRSVRTSTSKRTERNLYAVDFPLRPGETKMQVAFHMPYSGSLDLTPKSKYPLEHFVVMLPKAMNFEAKVDKFQTVKEGPGSGTANVQVVTNAQAGQVFAFKISGTGTLPPETESAGSGASEGGPNNGGASGEGLTSRPGGGLGPPSEAPDPLQNFRWWILGAFGLVLVGGGIYVTMRNKNAAMAGGGSAVVAPVANAYSTPTPLVRAADPVPMRAAAVTTPMPTNGSSASVLIHAMKDELFQLEMDRHQGRISPEEYQTTKAALDQTLARAIQREARQD